MAQLFIQQFFPPSHSANNKTEKLYCCQLKIQDEQQVCNKKLIIVFASDASPLFALRLSLRAHHTDEEKCFRSILEGINH
jgi:hypothetical protein